MGKDILKLPDSKIIKTHIFNSLKVYWDEDKLNVLSLPIVTVSNPAIKIPLKMEKIKLPPWAIDQGINGFMLIPKEAILGDPKWENIDYWLAMFLLLECWHERIWESVHGPIHSYSYRLVGWDKRVWDHAWVNRIAIFLRVWSFKRKRENYLNMNFEPTFVITHDVDAIKKTLAIRIKQSVFLLKNSLDLLLKGDLNLFFNRLNVFFKFLFKNEDWWMMDTVIEKEKKSNVNAIFNFYSDDRNKNFTRWLFDPSYSIRSKKMKIIFEKISANGSSIGLHPTFDSWNSSVKIRSQKNNLEKFVSKSIRDVRQHWLKFSWNDTWDAQSKASLKRDYTLMFNDRPGFRASAAIMWKPWNPLLSKNHVVEEIPTIIMDSHFYNYNIIDEKNVNSNISKWINEVKFVQGHCALLWHPHTLTKDYGWEKGFDHLLSEIK